MSTSAESIAFEKKLEHYRNLNAADTADTKPPGWDEAKPFKSIPGPRSFPLVGNIWRLMLPLFRGQDILEVHKGLYKEFGDIFVLKGMAGSWIKEIVTLYNPKDFETLARNEGVWPIRKNQPSLDYYQKIRTNLFSGIALVGQQREDWFKFRTIVNPIMMQPKNIAQYTDKMNLVADELVENIKYLATQNKDGEMPSDFKNELYKWALESVAVVTLDTHLGCLKQGLKPDAEPEKMIYSATQFFDLMYKLDILPSVWKLVSTKDWKKFVGVLDFMIQTNIKYINRALDKLEKEEVDTENEIKSVLQQLLKKDRKVAISMAISMMVAGIDTTGRVLGAGLYFLAKNPDKQIKLREEAISLLKTKETPITKEVLAKAPYLRAVVKEVTRLAPIGIGNFRTTVKDIILGGYQIPKGTDVLTSNLILCSMDEHYPKAKEFLPERWLTTTSPELSHKSANPFVFAPFGHGSRSCIGRRLANLELHVAFLKMIRNFDMRWEHEDMTFATTTLYGIAKPLKLRVKPLDQ
ncbi:cytochrome P450 CYP12A2-like isoform X2 [Zophobas morio]